MAFTFCSEVSRAGYTPAVYANTNWFNNYLTDPVFDAWGRWVAQYNSVCTYKGTYQMWQCTSDGYLAGLSGNNGRVDLNYELNNSSGHLGASKTGLQMINGDMYYLDGAGNKKTGWQTVGRNTYYFGSDGIMFRGEQTIDGRKLSFNQAGTLEGYWAKTGDAWYLRDQNGRNKIGWQHVKGSWYYLDPESARMKTGWLQQGGNWYYLERLRRHGHRMGKSGRQGLLPASLFGHYGDGQTDNRWKSVYLRQLGRAGREHHPSMGEERRCLVPAQP